MGRMRKLPTRKRGPQKRRQAMVTMKNILTLATPSLLILSRQCFTWHRHLNKQNYLPEPTLIGSAVWVWSSTLTPHTSGSLLHAESKACSWLPAADAYFDMKALSTRFGTRARSLGMSLTSLAIPWQSTTLKFHCQYCFSSFLICRVNNF